MDEWQSSTLGSIGFIHSGYNMTIFMFIWEIWKKKTYSELRMETNESLDVHALLKEFDRKL